MVFIETFGQKPKSETPRPRSENFKNPRCKETQENEISRLIESASEILRLEQNFLNFRGTIHWKSQVFLCLQT